MIKAIGGELELAPILLAGQQPLAEALRPGPQQELLRSGRGAIRRAIELSGSRGPWLLPSYMCDSVKQPFDELGVEVHFFRILADARIDVAHLQAQLAAVRPQGLLFINYFGMPLLAHEASAIADAQAAGCLVIEDGTHGSVLEAADAPAGHLGDFVVSSLRKYLPVPDGAVLRLRTARAQALAQPAAPAPTEEALTFARQRVLAKMLRWEFVHGAAADLDSAESTFMEMFMRAEGVLDASAAVWQASPWAKQVLAAQDLEQVRAQRRRNYETLLRLWQQPETGLSRWATPLYPELPAQASPFAFPVLAAPTHRNALRRGLVGEKLFCPVLWPLPAAVDTTEFATSAELSARIMCIPLDQRYTPADMQELTQRFARVAEQVYAG